MLGHASLATTQIYTHVSVTGSNSPTGKRTRAPEAAGLLFRRRPLGCDGVGSQGSKSPAGRRPRCVGAPRAWCAARPSAQRQQDDGPPRRRGAGRGRRSRGGRRGAAGGRAAVRPGQRQRPDLCPAATREHRQGAEHRLVGRADPAPVQHRHGRPPGNHPGVGDHAGRDRQDSLARNRSEIHASVPTPPGARGPLERTEHRRHWVEWPAPTGPVCRRLAPDPPPRRTRDLAAGPPSWVQGCGQAAAHPGGRGRSQHLVAADWLPTPLTGAGAVAGAEVETMRGPVRQGRAAGATDTMGTGLSSCGAGERGQRDPVDGVGGCPGAVHNGSGRRGLAVGRRTAVLAQGRAR